MTQKHLLEKAAFMRECARTAQTSHNQRIRLDYAAEFERQAAKLGEESQK